MNYEILLEFRRTFLKFLSVNLIGFGFIKITPPSSKGLSIPI